MLGEIPLEPMGKEYRATAVFCITLNPTRTVTLFLTQKPLSPKPRPQPYFGRFGLKVQLEGPTRLSEHLGSRRANGQTHSK